MNYPGGGTGWLSIVMEILLVSKSKGAAGRVRINTFGLIMIALLLLSTAASIGYWGYVRGGDDTAARILNNPHETTELWQKEIVQQRQFLHRLRRDLEIDLNALSQGIGDLQGDLSRLDAVAERVAEANGFDPSEFSFAAPAPIGGPHVALTQPPKWDGLLENLDAMAAEIDRRDSKLTVIETFLNDKARETKIKPDGRPVQEGWISSGYGYRTDPVTGRREFHGGVDFAGKPGLEVKAVAEGVVTWSGRRWGYGYLVELKHGNGYLTRYAHNRTNLVKLGEKVKKGQAIALLGSSGRSTGPHVHFEVVRNDRTVNPWKFVREQSK